MRTRVRGLAAHLCQQTWLRRASTDQSTATNKTCFVAVSAHGLASGISSAKNVTMLPILHSCTEKAQRRRFDEAPAWQRAHRACRTRAHPAGSRRPPRETSPSAAPARCPCTRIPHSLKKVARRQSLMQVREPATALEKSFKFRMPKPLPPVLPKGIDRALEQDHRPDRRHVGSTAEMALTAACVASTPVCGACRVVLVNEMTSTLALEKNPYKPAQELVRKVFAPKSAQKNQKRRTTRIWQPGSGGTRLGSWRREGTTCRA